MCDVKRPKSLTDTTIREVEQEVMKNIGSDIFLHYHPFYIMGPNNGPPMGDLGGHRYTPYLVYIHTNTCKCQNMVF